MASKVALNTGFCYHLLHFLLEMMYSQSLLGIPQVTTITAGQRSSVEPPLVTHGLQIQLHHLRVAAWIVNLCILLYILELDSACSA